MHEKNAHDNSPLPAELLRPTPRHVRPNAAGAALMFGALALVIGGLWGGTDLYRQARESERRMQLFATESVTTEANVVRIQRRGGGNNRRSVVHYRYAAGTSERMGAATLRRADRDRYAAGSRVSVRYLASDPGSSWIEGQAPRTQPVWPAFAIPLGCMVAAGSVLVLIRRQSHLLTYGRPTMGVVTKVETKKSDKGSYWRIHYEWTVLSGARRQGRYNHWKKNPPAVGRRLPIVYDRDSEKSARYPLSLVAIRN